MAPETVKAQAMDIRLVRRTLLDIAGDESPGRPDAAIQALAVAILHVAEGMEEIKASLARLAAQPAPKLQAKRRPQARRRMKRKKPGVKRGRQA
jgi:hypothetical protein